MTDEALDLFAKQVILDSLRFERENTGETKTGFSPSKKYQHQMREMVADPQGWCKRKMRPAWKKALRRVAAVFLAATVGVSAWLAVDTGARAAFFGWVKEIYETYVVFRHDGITDTVPESADYRPTWLPILEALLNDSGHPAQSARFARSISAVWVHNLRRRIQRTDQIHREGTPIPSQTHPMRT